jgi:hypothetical protein
VARVHSKVAPELEEHRPRPVVEPGRILLARQEHNKRASNPPAPGVLTRVAEAHRTIGHRVVMNLQRAVHERAEEEEAGAPSVRGRVSALYIVGIHS